MKTYLVGPDTKLVLGGKSYKSGDSVSYDFEAEGEHGPGREKALVDAGALLVPSASPAPATSAASAAPMPEATPVAESGETKKGKKE